MIEYPKYLEINEFSNTEDLYICALGFEDRSFGSNNALKEKNFKTKKTLVINYDSYIQNNEKDKQQLEKIWHDFSEDVQYVDHISDNRIQSIQNLLNVLESLKSESKNVTINISSFKTHVQIWLLNYAFDNFENTRIIYTEPNDYGDQSQSENVYASGVKEIFTMPDFSGAILPGYSSLLVIFLGYDFVRAGGTYEHIQPSKKIGIMGEPNTIGLENRFEKIKSKHQLNFGSLDEILKISIFDLKKLIEKLDEIRFTNIETCNISFALNGSKLHSIAAILFAKKFKDIQVVMSTPTSYFPENFSKGVNRTFELTINKEWLKEFQKK